MIQKLDELDEQIGVFADRADAGRKLAALLAPLAGSSALVLAVPAGGVPVAAEVARALRLPLDVAVVSKVTLPWNSEVGCGAVAFDGSCEIDAEFAEQVGLRGSSLRLAIEQTRQKVDRRLALFHQNRAPEPLNGRPVVLIDDGVASGATLMLAASALRRAGVSRVSIAVPTGPLHSIERLADKVDDVYCANVRSTRRFSVAAAYREWRDEDENEMARVVAQFQLPKVA